MNNTIGFHLGFADDKLLLCRETFRHCEDERKGELLRARRGYSGQGEGVIQYPQTSLQPIQICVTDCPLLQPGDNIKERSPPSINPRPQLWAGEYSQSR